MASIHLPAKSQKSEKQRHDTAVQGTNDSSIISKCSASSLGYFNDDFVKYFVAKQVRRCPLINRGYYIRAKAIQRAFDEFLQLDQGVKKQIVSLGCGFDSAYWRLKNLGSLKDVVYIEIDFLDVAKRKAALIKSKSVLRDMMTQEMELNNSNIILNTSDYKLLGVDLSNLKLLQETLEACSIDYNAATMLISEVSMTYMAPRSVDTLLKWTAESFLNGMFVTYEQIQPFDPFGVVMLKHFKKIGSKLRNIEKYPTRQEQVTRYKNLGWKFSDAVDVNLFLYGLIPEQERSRIIDLELFDEFEEWHCKCAHYILLVAANGICLHTFNNIFQTGPSRSRGESQITDQSQQSYQGDQSMGETENIISQTNGRIQLRPYSIPSDTEFNKRYGHCCTMVNDEIILCLGGFGEEMGVHKRISKPYLINTKTNIHTTCNITEIDHAQNADKIQRNLSERMYSTVTYCGEGRSLVFGGRLSPKYCCDSLLEIDMSTSLNTVQQDEAKELDPNVHCRKLEFNGEVPPPRWRHSASLVTISGKNLLVIFGGKNPNGCLGDCYMLDLQSFSWEKVNMKGEKPKARHSHTADSWKDKLVVTGGLGAEEKIEEKVFMLDLSSFHSCYLPLQDYFIPRYSHTSAIVDDQLILVGGVTVLPETTPGVAVVNLLTGLVTEYALPPVDPERPIMLHNHQSVLVRKGVFIIVGGGGNCFSFGTHLNEQTFVLDCTACLQ